MKSNLSEAEHMAKLSNELELPLKVRRLKPAGSAITNREVIDSPSEAYSAAIKIFRRLDSADLEDIMKPGNNSDRLTISDNDCGAATRSMHVAHDGSISPCIFLGPTYSAAKDAFEQTSLGDIWRTDLRFRAFRNRPTNPTCSSCAKNSACNSECPAIRLYTTGSTSGDDPSCPALNGLY